MIDFDHITRNLRSSICAELEVLPESPESFRVFTPFTYDDGDEVALTVRRDGERWIVTDEGSAFMRLSYDFDSAALLTDTRQRFIRSAFALGRAENRNGQVTRPVEDDDFGDAVFGVAQTVLRLASVSLLTQERIRSAFLEDLHQLVERTVPADRRTEGWSDPRRDPAGFYRVDYRIEGRERPLFVFALTSTGKVKDATISVHQYMQWHVDFQPVGIYQDPESVSKRARGQFSDVAKTLRLVGNENRVAEVLRRHALAA